MRNLVERRLRFRVVLKRVAAKGAGVGPHGPATSLRQPGEEAGQVVHVGVAVADKKDSKGITGPGGPGPGKDDDGGEQPEYHVLIVQREPPRVKPRRRPAFD